MVIYFSATGNSKYCAEKIAGVTNDRLFSLRDAMKYGQKEIDLGGDSQLVIVSPVYDMGMSWAVKEFPPAPNNSRFPWLTNIPIKCYTKAVYSANLFRPVLHTGTPFETY